MSQNRMKKNIAQKELLRKEQIIFSLQPYKQTSLKDKGHHKLAPKFYGTY